MWLNNRLALSLWILLVKRAMKKYGFFSNSMCDSEHLQLVSTSMHSQAYDFEEFFKISRYSKYFLLHDSQISRCNLVSGFLFSTDSETVRAANTPSDKCFDLLLFFKSSGYNLNFSHK